jgi:hypothetical protein
LEALVSCDINTSNWACNPKNKKNKKNNNNNKNNVAKQLKHTPLKKECPLLGVVLDAFSYILSIRETTYQTTFCCHASSTLLMI